MKSNSLKMVRPFLFLLMLAVIMVSCKKENTAEEQPTPETPQITSISPKNPQPDDVVTITGTGFGNIVKDLKVSVGNTALSITSVTNTEIKFTVPATLVSGTLTVTIKGVAAIIKDPLGASITVKPKTAATPTFTAMSPANGKVGDVITLTGTNFNPQMSENKVFFATTTGGTVVLATVKSASTTQLTVEVPASAVTGGVSITVSGNNAVVAEGFNTTFTVNTTSGTGGNTVSYINALSGNLSFSKIATAAKEIGAMIIDRPNNMIYYSDYTILNSANGQNTVYKLNPAGTGTPAVLTTDARITGIVKLTTDAAGNVYALKYEGTGPSIYSVYKISANGATVVEVLKSFDMNTRYSSKYFFFINSAGEICFRPGLKINASGALVSTETSVLSGVQQKDGGAFVDGANAYLLQSTANNEQVKTIKFIKWNLSTNAVADAGLTPTNIFSADDAGFYSSTDKLSYIKYAFDASKNMYAITDHSYQSGQTSKTWIVRKVAAGSNSSTLLGTFLIKFPAVDLNDYNSSVEFIADAAGNLYFKANQKDIIKVKQ